MAPRRGTLSKLWVHRWDFSGISNQIGVELGVEFQEWQTFQSDGPSRLATTPTGTIKQNGYFFDTGANTFEQEMAEAIAGSETMYVAALLGTDTATCPAYVARAADLEGMTISTPFDGLISLSGTWARGAGILRGLRAYDGAISATGAQAYIDLGAAGAAGGYVWLFVQSITGTASGATFVVQSDDNTGFSSPAAEATFTVSAVGGYEQAMSGAIDRYVRLNVTSMGGATGFAVGLIVAVSGRTY